MPVQVFPSLLLSFLSVGGLRGWYVGSFAKINNWSSTLGQLSAFQYIVENVCVYVFYLTKRNCVTQLYIYIIGISSKGALHMTKGGCVL